MTVSQSTMPTGVLARSSAGRWARQPSFDAPLNAGSTTVGLCYFVNDSSVVVAKLSLRT